MKNQLRSVLKELALTSLFCFMAVIFTGCDAANVVTIAPTDANIQYHGRWNFSDPSVPWVYWQGSSIIVNFDGTGKSLAAVNQALLLTALRNQIGSMSPGGKPKYWLQGLPRAFIHCR